MKKQVFTWSVIAFVALASLWSPLESVMSATIGDNCGAPNSASQKTVQLLFSTKEAWDANDGDIFCKIIDAKSTAVTYEDLRPFFAALGIPQDLIDGSFLRNEGTNVEGKCSNWLIGTHANEKFNTDQDLEDIQISFLSVDSFDCTVGISEPGAPPLIEPNTPIRYRLEIPGHANIPQTDYYIYFKSVIQGSNPLESGYCQCVIGGEVSIIPELASEQSCVDASGSPISHDGASVEASECIWTAGESKKVETQVDNTYTPESTLPTSLELSSKLNPLGTFTLPQLLGRIIKSALGILGSIALVIFLYGGIMWMTSMGSADKIQKALSTLLWGALGVIVILASYSIVSFVLENIPK